jgi:hypothetical protein
MKLKLSNNYYRPREVLLETMEECQMLDMLAHFASCHFKEFRQHMHRVNNEYPTDAQMDSFEKFINSIRIEFIEQEPLWRSYKK